MSEENKSLDSSLGIPAPEIVTLPPSDSGSVDTSSTPAPVVETKQVETPTDIDPLAKQPDNEGNDANFDDFERMLETGISKSKKEKSEEKAVEAKLETDKEKQQAAISKTKPESVPTSKVPVVKRDLTGYSPEEAQWMSKMSNEAFNFVTAKFARQADQVAKLGKELGELRAGRQVIPETLYEHPQAFVVTPEWNKATEELNEYTLVQQHYQDAMAKVRTGQKWNMLARDSNGKLILGAEREGDARAEAELMSWIPAVANQIAKKQDAVLKIQSEFSSKHQEASKMVEDATNKYFGFVDDPTQKLSEIRDTVMNNIPVQFRKHPITKLAVYATTALIHSQNTLKNAIAQKTKEEETAAQKDKLMRNAGPTESTLNAGAGNGKGSKGSNNDITMDDFEAVLNG